MDSKGVPDRHLFNSPFLSIWTISYGLYDMVKNSNSENESMKSIYSKHCLTIGRFTSLKELKVNGFYNEFPTSNEFARILLSYVFKYKL